MKLKMRTPIVVGIIFFVFGCGVLFLQQRAIKELRGEIQNIQLFLSNKVDVDAQSGDLLYVSSDLGYSLIIPEEWCEYGYTVEYKYVPKEQDEYGVDRWEETFYADFPDWSRFELFTIGSVPKSIYYTEKQRHIDIKDALEKEEDWESYIIKYRGPSYFWGEKLVETDTHVFYSYMLRHDSPNKVIEGAFPMPDFEKDFSIKK